MEMRLINKHGTTIVEASIAMPLVILLVLSMILLIFHYYNCLNTQIKVHNELLSKPVSTVLIYENTSTYKLASNRMKGVVNRLFTNRITDSFYLINEINLVRAGDFFDKDESQ